MDVDVIKAEEMMKKNLAVIGASYLQLPLILKAKEMGYTTHVFAWKADDVGESAADHFYPISIIEKDAILNECSRIGICGICSIASDLAAVTVNHVADRLHLTGNSPECTLKSTHKYEMRNAFRDNHDPGPDFLLVKDSADIKPMDLKLPVIVKPTDRSGSRAVTRVDSVKDLEGAVRRALDESFEKRAIIEEYVEGTEYSLEGMSWKGQHHILAMTLKQTTGAPHFIETGHVQPAPVDRKTFELAKKTVIHALTSLDVQNSASHSEIRISRDGRINIIEIGARMGGDCIGSDLVPLSTGIDYVKAVIMTACSQKPDLSPKNPPGRASVHYIFNRQDELIMEEFRKAHPERFAKLVYLNKDLYDKTTNRSDRSGCYITIDE